MTIALAFQVFIWALAAFFASRSIEILFRVFARIGHGLIQFLRRQRQPLKDRPKWKGILG